MIVLPTRRRLVRRRDTLYRQLESILQHASVSQVEDVMRRIHTINLRLRTYFQREHEPTEIFESQDTFTA